MLDSAKEDEVLFSGEPQFGSRDNCKEYGGKGLKGNGKGKGKGKSSRHCSAKFEKPMVPCDSASAKGSVLSDGSVSDSASQGGGCKTVGKGGREKIIISASSFPTSSDG